MRRTIPSITREYFSCEATREFKDLPQFSGKHIHAVRKMSREDLQKIKDSLFKYFAMKNKDTGEGFHKSDVSICDIAKKTGISKNSLYRYVQKLDNDPDFNPKTHHDGYNTAMSVRLELELVMEIEQNYIIPGFYFNNKILKVMALAIWRRADPEDRKRDFFMASARWCRNFRKRHSYVWRKAKAVRKANSVSEEDKKRFVADIERLYIQQANVGLLELVINVDEACWKLCYTGDFTWAKKARRL